MREKLRQLQAAQKPGSMVWRHMTLMLIVLALSLAALSISNRISLNTLAREKKLEIQTALDRNSKEFSTEITMTGSISNAVTGSRYYEYIRSVREDVLPEQYYTALPMLQSLLSSQVYSRGDADITLLYFPNCNSIVSTIYICPVAEDFFEDVVSFPKTPGAVLIGYMKDGDALKLLPLQKAIIKTGDRVTEEKVLPVVIRDSFAPLSTMSLYSQDVVLSKFGISELPEDTYFQITSHDGQVLMRYPDSFDTENQPDRVRFDAAISSSRSTVSIWVSQTAFTNLLRPARILGNFLITFVALAGLVLSFILSRVSVEPLRKLISNHDTDFNQSTNEISHLNTILSRSRERVHGLENALVGSLLAKVFSGVVLSEEELQMLRTHILPDGKEYRVAVMGGQPEAMRQIILELTEKVTNAVALISPSQIGVVFSAELDLPEQLVSQQNSESDPELGIRCGISAPFSELLLLPTAIRQARFAAPAEPGTSIYQGNHLRSHVYSRLQHERLYQCIFQDDLEGAMELLSGISQKLTMGSAREIYYNVRFTLRCAAEEMELDMSSFETEYRPDQRPRENMDKLANMLQAMFLQIRRRSDGSITTMHDQVLEWIRENAFDPNLCVASISAHFSISKNKVYEIVKGACSTGLNDYILSIRMKKAGNLLYSTQLSVGDVALQCGYLAESTFYRVFKKYHGVTPIQYRQNGALPETQ